MLVGTGIQATLGLLPGTSFTTTSAQIGGGDFLALFMVHQFLQAGVEGAHFGADRRGAKQGRIDLHRISSPHAVSMSELPHCGFGQGLTEASRSGPVIIFTAVEFPTPRPMPATAVSGQ